MNKFAKHHLFPQFERALSQSLRWILRLSTEERSSMGSDVIKSQGKRMKIAILGSRGIPAKYGGFETFA
jgi:hypothetical protein